MAWFNQNDGGWQLAKRHGNLAPAGLHAAHVGKHRALESSDWQSAMWRLRFKLHLQTERRLGYGDMLCHDTLEHGVYGILPGVCHNVQPRIVHAG
jgi:hypothetical protein